jgi:uncharacterized protein
MDNVVHFEIPTEDKERAGKFYNKVFDWKLNPMPEMKYTIVHTGEVDDTNNNMPKEKGFINGGLFDRGDGPLQNVIITIKVDNIDSKLEEIKSNGGLVVKEKNSVGDMGFIAYFKDTENNVVGLWEDAKKSE